MHNEIKDLVIILAIAVLLVAGGFAVFSLRVADTIKPVACTKEAKLCPDGSAVGRIGPNCAFAACSVAAISPEITSGVDGLVALSPTCPVERIPPDPNCAPKPYQIKIQITKVGDVTFAQEITSSAEGKIGVDLAPGTYQFVPVSAGILPRCNPATAVVEPNAWTTINISCDTGIR